MYALKATEKPKFAKRNSDDFYYRDRGRVDCEGSESATKFKTEAEAQAVAENKHGYVVVDVE